MVDPFGHSNTNVRISNDMGFDAWFFARLDYMDKAKRMDEKEMEFIWRPNKDSLGNDVQVFTHALVDHYCSPHDFDNEVDSNDKFSRWVNNETYRDFNAKEAADAMVKEIEWRASHYLHDEVLMLFGCDF